MTLGRTFHFSSTHPFVLRGNGPLCSRANTFHAGERLQGGRPLLCQHSTPEEGLVLGREWPCAGVTDQKSLGQTCPLTVLCWTGSKQLQKINTCHGGDHVPPGKRRGADHWEVSQLTWRSSMFCCGCWAVSVFTRPIVGTWYGTMVNGDRRERAGGVGWKKPAEPGSSPRLRQGNRLPPRAFRVDISLIHSCCQGMVAAFRRAADVLCSAHSVRIV